MQKERFQCLFSFKYDNKEYMYLISKKYPFYFLEYNSKNNTFEYPDITIYKKLFNIFYNNDSLLAKETNNNASKRNKVDNISFNIVPLIKTTKGLISILLALSICGCTQIDNKKEDTTTSNQIAINKSITQDDKNKEISDYFKDFNMDVINKEYSNADYIFVKSFINSNNKYQVTLQNYEEFRDYVGLNFLPTWDNIIEAFNNNTNITDDKKNIILKCINNMKNTQELKDLDLSVLYINAKKMKFEYLTSEEIKNKTNRESAYAYFDTVTKTVYLPSDQPLKTFEFIHEVLGHGSLAYREETEDSIIVFDCTNYLMLPTDNKYTGYSVGIMVSEGGANLIAHFATQDYSVSTFYEIYEEELRVIANLCNVSIGELFNHKGIDLYDLMYQNHIDTPVEYIFKMDGIYKGQIYCEFSDLMERLFVDATEERIINADQKETDEIIQDTVQIIKNSYLKDKGALHFEYPGGSVDYDFQDAANKYEDNIKHLKGKK